MIGAMESYGHLATGWVSGIFENLAGKAAGRAVVMGSFREDQISYGWIPFQGSLAPYSFFARMSCRSSKNSSVAPSHCGPGGSPHLRCHFPFPLPLELRPLLLYPRV